MSQDNAESELFFLMSGVETKVAEQQAEVRIVGLGEGNGGSIGPDNLGILPGDLPALADELGKPEYRRKASDIYTCVDGRHMVGYEPQLADGEGLTYVPGSKAIQDSAVDLMRTRINSDHPVEPRISKIVADRTRRAVAVGFTVIAHGGCGANGNLEASLRKNAERAHAVAPVAWSLTQAFGLDKWVKEDEIGIMIVNGKDNADDSNLFDVDADTRLDIMVENGAKRVDPEPGSQHREAAAGVTLDEDETLDNRAFAADHNADDGEEIEVFVATLGKAIKDQFIQAQKEGRTELDAAYDSVATILWTIAVTKTLSNDSLKAFLYSKLR